MDIARFIGPDSSPPQALEPTFTADARHGRRRGRSGRATPRRVVATPAALPEPDAPDWVTSGRQGGFPRVANHEVLGIDRAHMRVGCLIRARGDAIERNDHRPHAHADLLVGPVRPAEPD